MAALPATAILDSIRSLSGKARVTFPDGNKRVERIARFPKDNWELDFDTADQEFTDCFLTDQQKLKEDAQYVEVYRVYDKLPGTALTGIVVTPEGQVGTLTRQPVLPGTSISPDAKMASGSVQPTGAGKSVLETVTVTDVFPETSESKSQVTKIPERFFSAPITTVSNVTPDTDTTTSTGSGGTGVIAQSKQRVTAFKVKTSTTTAPGSTASLGGKQLDNDGQIVTLTSSIESSDTISTGATTVIAKTDPIGGGKYEKTIGTVSTVFPQTQIHVRKDVSIPSRFFSSTNSFAETTSTKEGSTITSADSTLAGNELSRSAEQVDTTKIRVSFQTFSLSSTNDLSTEETTGEYGGGVIKITETLAGSTQSAETGFTVIGSKVTALGGGSTIRETRKMDGSTYAVLNGAEYDPEFDITRKYTVQVVDASTTATTGQSLKPIDKWKAQLESTEANSYSTLATWSRVQSAIVNINMPDVLQLVTIHYAASGDCSDVTGGTGNGMTVSATGSITVTGDAEVRVREGYRGPASGSTVDFFISSTQDALAECKSKFSKVGALVEEWPTWNPSATAIIVHGESKTIRVSLQASGFSVSNHIERSSNHTIKVVNLPSALHGGITIGGDVAVSGDPIAVSATSPTFSYKVRASATFDHKFSYLEGSTVYDSTIKRYVSTDAVTATGFHTPVTLTATLPATWPTIAIQDLSVKPYKHGWSAVRAVLVNLSTHKPNNFVLS